MLNKIHGYAIAFLLGVTFNGVFGNYLMFTDHRDIFSTFCSKNLIGAIIRLRKMRKAFKK